MSGRILLVTGSRALEGSTEQRTAMALLRTVFETFVPAFVVAGDARGPDEWAIEIAANNEATLPYVRIYGLDGFVKLANGARVRRWTDAEKFTPLDHNAAMVRDVARQARKGAMVQVLALEASWSATKGTAHTAGLALRAGLAVVHTVITGTRIQEGSDEG